MRKGEREKEKEREIEIEIEIIFIDSGYSPINHYRTKLITIINSTILQIDSI